MPEHPNAKLVLRCYEAFSSDDAGAIDEVLDAAVVWHEPGQSPLGGDHAGQNGVRDLLEKFGTLSGGTFKLDLVDILANANRAVAAARNDGQPGRPSAGHGQCRPVRDPSGQGHRSDRVPRRHVPLRRVLGLTAEQGSWPTTVSSGDASRATEQSPSAQYACRGRGLWSALHSPELRLKCRST